MPFIYHSHFRLHCAATDALLQFFHAPGHSPRGHGRLPRPGREAGQSGLK